MLIRRPDAILTSEITPPDIYRERRHFMQGMGALAAGSVIAAAPDAHAAAKLAGVRARAYKIDEARTPYKDVTTYNNFYEFGTGKSDPCVEGWSIVIPWVGFPLAELLRRADQQGQIC